MGHKIPDQNNLYGTIFNVVSKKSLAEMFGSKGWSVRKLTWTDFEVRNEWGELAIESDDRNPLINGAIEPLMFDELVLLLNLLNTKFSLELYDDTGALIKEAQNLTLS